MNVINPAIGVASIPINILLADDDSDDRHFFERALLKMPVATRLTSVVNGEKLMTYLLENSHQLPDVLFLDFNMPRKNGFECMVEINQHELLKSLPVVVLSTALHHDLADLLYKAGAFYYVRKTNLVELEMMLHQVLTLMIQKKFVRPGSDKFLLDLAAV